MKKLLLILMLCVPCIVSGLESASITMTNLRGEAQTAADSATFYRGDQIQFTNCIAYSGTSTSSAIQDLTGLTLTVSHGDSIGTTTVGPGQSTMQRLAYGALLPRWQRMRPTRPTAHISKCGSRTGQTHLHIHARH